MRTYVLRDVIRNTRIDIVYVRLSIRVPRPTLGQNEFFSFSKARFSKRLERFGSTLLL